MHTPGPWYWSASTEAGIAVFSDVSRSINARLAVIDANGVNGAGAANARLIAAAPDLLAALELALGSDDPSTWEQDAWNAISKARGE